jgi:hypothetical protein
MFDILSNHNVKLFKAHAVQSAGAEVWPTAGYFDMWAAGTAPPPLQYQRPQRALIIIDVSVVAGGGVETLVFQDCDTPTGSYDADFATATAITATGLYLVDLPDFKRYLRCTATNGTANVTFGMVLVTFEDRFRPVDQSGTILTLTYGAGRTGRVATV